MSLANYDRRYKRAQRETVIINRFKTKTNDTIKTLDDIVNRHYEFKLKDETVMGQITDIKPNEKDMIIVVDGKREVPFHDVSSLRLISYDELKRKTFVLRENTNKRESAAINGEFKNSAYSTHLVNIIKRCINNNFKECFKEEYGNNNALHNLPFPLYKKAIESFGDTLDDNLKRKLASAIQIMADYHKNKNTKNELERFANQYHWAFKRSFGGTRKTRRKALRKTLRKK